MQKKYSHTENRYVKIVSTWQMKKCSVLVVTRKIKVTFSVRKHYTHTHTKRKHYTHSGMAESKRLTSPHFGGL